MIDLDAIRERDRISADTWFKVPNKDHHAVARAIQDRRALLSHIYDMTKQRAIDAEEIRRLRAELAGREFVVYRNCPKHLSVPWTTFAVPYAPMAREVCPICEPPK